MLRRTKILATLGPATDAPGVLEAMVREGLDAVRLNFSHGAAAEHARRAAMARAAAARLGRDLAVLADLQGPKIRIQRFAAGPVQLREGEWFVIDPTLPADAGDEHQVGVTYAALPDDVVPGDVLLLDDGAVSLRVEAIQGRRVRCQVMVGGGLSDHKGINRQGGGLSAPALTEKDLADIAVAADIDADYLAVSFPRHAADIEQARELLRSAGGRGRLIAKIERAEAVAASSDIVRAADGIMIARGDLGVEIGDAALPAVQKQLIQQAREANRLTITATQMMQSMIDSELPTRAEVFDVANAVLDGTDAVMLSAETATGRHPAKVVAAMARICRGAESHPEATTSKHRLTSRFQRRDEAIAMATMYTANHLAVGAIAAITESGATPLWMSRIHSGIPIYALTPHEHTRRRVALMRNVHPVDFDAQRSGAAALDELRALGVVAATDSVIVTQGDRPGFRGGTNGMKILQVEAAQ